MAGFHPYFRDPFLVLIIIYMSDVRVRFAPSPTGMLHIGGLRTALHNYLYARKHGGTFVLRIEDTDQTRFVEDAEDDITSSLKWAGMDYDEGPDKGGKYGPYRQSERSSIYKQYADQLIEQGQAYYAFDTTEEIEDMRERLQKSGNPSPKYDSITRMSMKNSITLPKEEVKERLESGEPYVVRLKVPRKESVRFEDLIRGFVSFETSGLDDQVLLKSDGLPTYHLANVVDDHLMGITHVIRGEEWLSSAPKHALLYEYLGWGMPHMAHLPLIMSPTGGKLSKRNAEKMGIPVNVRDYVAQQYEPEAVVNFLAFLGWSPGDEREFFKLEEMVQEFSLERVSKSGAIFDHKKLIWFNEHYMRARPEAELLPAVRSKAEEKGYSGYSDAFLETVIRLMKERSSLVTELLDEADYLFQAPDSYDEKTTKKAWKSETAELLTELNHRFSSIDEWTAPEIKNGFSELLNEKELGFGKLALPLRLLITGVGFGPDLFQIMELIGKDETQKRISAGAANLA